MLENSTRVRSPEAVADEMAHGIRRWGFRSFKFRDPLFGLRRAAVFELAERIGRLPRKIQFSIETRIDLLPAEMLRTLRRVGLTSITVGIETPDDGQLRRYLRAPIREDRQREFIDQCRRLGIRTVGGFLIGFPEDTEESIQRVRALRPGPQSDVRQFQRRDALSGHGLLRADAAADRGRGLEPLHGLHAGVEVSAFDAAGGWRSWWRSVFTATISAGRTCARTRRCCGRCCGSWVFGGGSSRCFARRAEAGGAAVASRRRGRPRPADRADGPHRSGKA